MIFVAYVFLIIAVAAYVRGSVASVPRGLELPARVLGAVVGIGFMVVALFLLRGHPSALGTGVLLVIAIAAGVYVWGLARWRAADGVALRHIGWFAIVAALVVPSTLTLLMPVACLLLLTVHSMPQTKPAVGRLGPSTRP